MKQLFKALNHDVHRSILFWEEQVVRAKNFLYSEELTLSILKRRLEFHTPFSGYDQKILRKEIKNKISTIEILKESVLDSEQEVKKAYDRLIIS